MDTTRCIMTTVWKLCKSELKGRSVFCLVLLVVVQKVRGVMVSSGASATFGVVLVFVVVGIVSDGSGVFVGGV